MSSFSIHDMDYVSVSLLHDRGHDGPW